MSRPKNPTEKVARKRNRPSPRTRQREDHDDYTRTIPGRRTPENERRSERVVNEDEQLKVVNEREDNAQSRDNATASGQRSETETNRTDQPHENERVEAGDDNNEVHPREPKVN
jgi:hypothetical protein